MDDKLTQLRASWQAKHDEANALLSKSDATGADLTKAETLFDERDAIQKSIEDHNAGLAAQAGKRKALQGRATTGTDWDTRPAGGVPFAAKGGDGAGAFGGSFELKDFSAAGYVRLDEHRRIVEEVGPGTFGAKTWDLLQSFEYRKDFAQYLRKGQRYADRCTKTLMEGSDDQGGVFAPAELLMRVVGRRPAPTQLRGLVQSMTTGRDMVSLPRLQYSADDIYTTAFRATWTGEVPAADPDVDDSKLVGNVDIPVHTAMLSAPLSRNLMEDAGFPIQSWTEGKLNEAIDLLYEEMIARGTGIGQPTGIWANIGATTSPAVVLSGTANALSYAGFVNTQTELAPQYEGPSTRWVMNKKSGLRAVMKLVDGQQRPIFSQGVTTDGLMVRRERVILGDEIVLSQFAPDVGDGLYPVAYGDLQGYYLVNRIGFSIQVLDQTKAKRNQVELVGRVRFGGAPVEHWRLKLLKSDDA